MMKLPAKPPPPAIVNRTVKMPRRRPNAELRSREHLTDAEIERLMATAWNNRWGHRDATMILVAYRHGLSEGLGKGTTASVEPKSEHINSTAAPIPLRPPCEPPAPALSKSSSPRCVPLPGAGHLAGAFLQVLHKRLAREHQVADHQRIAAFDAGSMAE